MDRTTSFNSRRSGAGHRRRDLVSIAISFGVVALLVVAGTGRAPESDAAPPPADQVSHGAAGTARNGVGGSIAASPTMASWPGTGNNRNGGAFAFIGAQYGSLWKIPPMANNSLGVGYCVMEDIGGEGVVSLQPDPAVWDAGEMARAAALMASFGGDRVVPYAISALGPYDVASGEWKHPTLFGSGEYTRRRHVAVNFGVKMFLEDVSPTGVAAGRKLARDTAVVDGSGSNFPALRDGYTVAKSLANVAEIQHATGGVRVELRWRTPGGAVPERPGTYPLEIRTTDATGKPVGFVPVVQLSATGVGGRRSIGAVANVNTSTSSAHDRARLAAAVATGWPTMDMARRLVDSHAHLLSSAPTSAAVSSSGGIARFDVAIDRQDWELGFMVQAPTADVALYAGTGIQGQVTWRGAPQSATVHQVAPPPRFDELVVRKLIEPTDIRAGRDLSGFEFTIAPRIGNTPGPARETHRAQTDANGATPPIELPAGRYRVREVDGPSWAAGLLDGGPVDVRIDPGVSSSIVEVSYTNTEPSASITTAASDDTDGDQMVDLALGEATVVDRVTYEGLVPGTAYRAVGELMWSPGAEPDGDVGETAATALEPTGIVGSSSFVADAADGSVDVTMVVPQDSPLLGHHAVVYQRIEVEESGRTVVTHDDPTSIEQTIWFPFATTVLVADEPNEDGQLANTQQVETGTPLVDLLTVYGLRPGHRYRADLVLHERLDDGTCIATDQTASAEFDVLAGTEPLMVTVGGIRAPRPGVFVAYQEVSALEDDGERVVAVHADCDSTTQRVDVVAPTTTTTSTTTTTTTIASTSTAPTTTTPATSPTTTTTRSVVPPPTTLPTGRLSQTGSDASATIVNVAVALFLAGAGLTILVRRPPPPRDRRAGAR